MKQFILIFLVLLPVCVFAQFTETFDGPEINSANPWKGGLEKFIINNDGWLQLNGPKDKAGKANLRCEISYAPTMQWEFDVRMDEAPSENNFLRLYLYMESDEVYYYVQIGHNGSKKISLRRNGKKELFPLKESELTEKPVFLHLKVTLENNEIWTLYSRKQKDSYYRLEGTCSYPIHTPQEKGDLILNIEYTQSRYHHFAIDNLNVSYEITPTDTIPNETPVDPDPEEPSSLDVDLPELLAIQPLSLRELQFAFDQPVDITEARFAVSGIGKADRINYVDEWTKTTVNTRYPEEMVMGVKYTVSYEGITDLEGNKLTPFSENFMLEGDDEGKDEEKPDPGSILINEVMADPKGLKALPETEYVELYNTTGKTVSLSGWQFSYGGKAKPMTAFEIPAKGYAVLYRSGRDILVDPSAVEVPLENFPSALANSGKLLQLYNGNKELIDEVTYEKATPAKSWERFSSGGWHLSSDPRGGTPGSVNSSEKLDPEQPDDSGEPDEPEDPVTPDEPDTPDDPTVPDHIVEPGELIFNELLPNPFAEGSEYIELYNRSDRALSVSGLSVAVRKADGTLNTRYPLSSVTAAIEPEGYALLTKSLAGVTDFYTIQSPSALFEIPKLPILANTSSTLVLFRTKDDVVIDEVTYSSKWHASSVKDQKGVALERIDPEKETQSSSNWTSASATSGYGTPGYQNSQSALFPPDEPEQSVGIEIPRWESDADHYIIRYYLDQPGYNCRAFVFNTAGQRVAEIANHELLGLSGELTWDGSSLTGKLLRTGVYIFYAEIYHTSGRVKRFKRVFLIR